MARGQGHGKAALLCLLRFYLLPPPISLSISLTWAPPFLSGRVTNAAALAIPPRYHGLRQFLAIFSLLLILMRDTAVISIYFAILRVIFCLTPFDSIMSYGARCRAAYYVYDFPPAPGPGGASRRLVARKRHDATAAAGR